MASCSLIQYFSIWHSVEIASYCTVHFVSEVHSALDALYVLDGESGGNSSGAVGVGQLSILLLNSESLDAA